MGQLQVPVMSVSPAGTGHAMSQLEPELAEQLGKGHGPHTQPAGQCQPLVVDRVHHLGDPPCRCTWEKNSSSLGNSTPWATPTAHAIGLAPAPLKVLQLAVRVYLTNGVSSSGLVGLGGRRCYRRQVRVRWLLCDLPLDCSRLRGAAVWLQPTSACTAQPPRWHTPAGPCSRASPRGNPQPPAARSQEPGPTGTPTERWPPFTACITGRWSSWRRCWWPTPPPRRK